ncbi:two pore domain potassium channel family protein [Candidatus Peregrinibacteria bacterium]|nr:two pore domain potassium channel family protein [Candidatus Peregrinibacteria bacterium]
MEPNQETRHSFILSAVSDFIEWGNRWLTLSGWMLKSGETFFKRLEVMMLILTSFCISLPFWIDRIPRTAALVIAILLIQRIIELVIVYSRNFIFHRGRIFSYFKNDQDRGEWLLLMLSLNVAQIISIFATWYQLISLSLPGSFSHVLSAIDSLYFSVITFSTVGYDDIFPLYTLPKILVMSQNLLTFFVLVVVINGVAAAHFKK